MEEASAGPAGGASSSSTPRGAAGTPPPLDYPLLRLEWQEAPVHGLESTKFSIEVHHGGYFVRAGDVVSYLDKKSTVWFDNLDRTTFHIDTLYGIVSQLGYERRKILLWCPPGKDLYEAKEVILDMHGHQMAEASVESKVLVIFLHHLDEHEHEVKDEISDGRSSEDSEIDDPFQSSDEDPTFYDSDYDMKEDDDLYEENVDDSEADDMFDKGKQLATQHAHVPGEDDVTEGDLELPVEDDSERRHKSDSDDEEYKKKKKKKQVVYKFKPFNSAGDMENPQFKKGMIFDCVDVVRKAVSQYAIKERVQIRKRRNNKKRFEALCEGETPTGELCTWSFIVSSFVSCRHTKSGFASEIYFEECRPFYCARARYEEHQ